MSSELDQIDTGRVIPRSSSGGAPGSTAIAGLKRPSSFIGTGHSKIGRFSSLEGAGRGELDVRLG